MTRILVIEDQPDLRGSIVEQLEYEGFEVFDAPDGQDGVQVARDKLPDLIVCDIMMPKLDGYGVLLELRSDPSTAAIPFIFLTARAGRSDFRKGMELGADDYLTKPFTQDELLGAIQVALEKRQMLKGLYEQQTEELRQNLLQTLPHEFRTPLTGILGYGELLLEDYGTFTPDQVHRMAEAIVKTGNRLRHLIENYLLFAQLEIVKTDPVRLEKLRQGHVDDTSKIVAQSAEKIAAEKERQADLKLEVVPVGLAISEDGLIKIVEELVDNAFKFSEPGTVVYVKTVTDGSTFSLTIRDHGRGLTPEQIRHIGAYVQFERKLYEQQGMGLGLVLAKGLAELYGGKLTIASDPQHGTTVSVELPV